MECFPMPLQEKQPVVPSPPPPQSPDNKPLNTSASSYSRRLQIWSARSARLCTGCFDGDASLDSSFERRVEATNKLNESDILQEQELQAIHNITEEALFGEKLVELENCRTISFQRDGNSELHISLLETSVIEGEEVTFLENNFLNRSFQDTSSILEEEEEEKTAASNVLLNRSIVETSIVEGVGQEKSPENLLNRTISQLVKKQCFGESTVQLDERRCVRIAVVPTGTRGKPPEETKEEAPQGNVFQRMFRECSDMTLDDLALCYDCTQIRKEIKEEGFASLLTNWSCLTCDVNTCQ